jgi:hypothetical protein
MIARLTPYRTPPDELQPLIDEIVALARSSWPVKMTNRRAEFFFVSRSSGDGLSVVIGDDRTVTPVIDLGRRPSGAPEEYGVRLLQLGGPTESGVVDALFGRVVRCHADEPAELSFDGNTPPASPDVWARALLVAPNDALVLALAVASQFVALEESLRKFSARSITIDDYDDVAYHFLRHGDFDGTSPPAG